MQECPLHFEKLPSLEWADTADKSRKAFLWSSMIRFKSDNSRRNDFKVMKHLASLDQVLTSLDFTTHYYELVR